MPLIHRVRSLVRNLLRRSRVERELDAELREFYELVVQEKVTRGLSPEAARRQARVELGGLEQVKEEVRTIRAGALVEQFVGDARYALRGLRRSPAFTVTAVITLALGIGANTAIFSVIDALLLRPLPVTDPDRLVALYRGADGRQASFSYPEFVELSGQQQVFAGATAWGVNAAWLRTGADVDRVTVHIVSPNYFSVLGVSPGVGAAFADQDDTASRGTAIVSERMWRGRFAADPAVIGRTLRLNDQVLTIVGVAPSGFTGLQPSGLADLWITFATLADLEPEWTFRDRTEIWLRVHARLQPQLSPRVGETMMRPVSVGSPGGTQRPGAERVRLVPAATPIFDPEARESASRLALLVGAVAAFVLLIACANVASLLIVRGASRRRELGVRLAVGASRGRVIRQMVTESLLLCAVGWLSGLLLGHWTVQAVVAFAPSSAIPPGIEVSIDARVITFAALLSLVTTMLFGAGPAWQAARTDLLPLTRGASQSDPVVGRSGMVLRSGLVVAQVALSTVLLVGAGLFLRTLTALLSVDPGYDVNRVLLTSIDFSVARLNPAAARAAGDEIRDRVRALPGVSGAAFGSIVPFSGAFVMRPAVPSGQAFDRSREEAFLVPYAVVSDGFFGALDMPLRGRDFASTDTEHSPRVVIVNETLARRYWPGENAVGRRLKLPLAQDGPDYEVIAVVADGRYVSLEEAQYPYMYLSWGQAFRPRMTLHVRSSGDPLALAPLVRGAVRDYNPDLPSYNTIALREYVDRSTAQPRVVARLFVIFGFIALVVAAVGLYGLTAYSVLRRTKELGVRVALGAGARQIVGLLMSQATRLTVVGIGLGIAGAVLLGRLAESLLFGVTPGDPVTFGVSVLLLATTLLIATAIPARRATRVDPLAALRND